MNFRTYGALKAMVDGYNKVTLDEKLELWFPHMFRDGQWSVDLVFGKCPGLKSSAPFLSFCLANNLNAFFMTLNGDIALHIQ